MSYGKQASGTENPNKLVTYTCMCGRSLLSDLYTIYSSLVQFVALDSRDIS